MHRKAVAGCVYPFPEPDFPNYPYALPSSVDHLRAWQLRAMAPDLVGKPIRISHNEDDGFFTNPLCPTQRIKTNLPIFGAHPLGYVTNAWVNPDDNALHWSGIIEYDPESILAGTVTHTYPACSLSHLPATTSAAAIPHEISLCHNPKRPHSDMAWKDDISVYMRKTGFLRQTPAMSDPTPMVAAAAVAGTPPPQLDPDAARKAEYDAAINATPPIILRDLERLVEEQKETAALTKSLREQAAARNLEYIATISNIMTEMGLDKEAFMTSNKDLQPKLITASAASSEDTRALWQYIANLGGFLDKSIKQKPPTAAVPMAYTPSTESALRARRHVRPGDPLPDDDIVTAKRRADMADHLSSRAQPHRPYVEIPRPVERQYNETQIAPGVLITASNATDEARSALLGALQRHRYRPGIVTASAELSQPLPTSQNITVVSAVSTTALKP